MTWEQQLAELKATEREAYIARAAELMATGEDAVEDADDELAQLEDGWDDGDHDGDLIELALARFENR
jgi:hypothetical protein